MIRIGPIEEQDDPELSYFRFISVKEPAADAVRDARRRTDLHPRQRAMLWINVLGGAAFLCIYAWGLSIHRGTSGVPWGGVPDTLRPLYSFGMFPAVASYFAFTHFLPLRLNPAEALIAGRFGYSVFTVLYGLVLKPPALWMPLTFSMIGQPSVGLWIAIRVVLAVVGLASLGVLVALLALCARQPAWAYWLAVAGTIPLRVQTAVLDALVWPAFFRVKRRDT